MKRLFIVMCAACLAMTVHAGTMNYTADNTTIFSNPERGFITMLTRHLTTKRPYAVKGKEEQLEAKKADEKMSIVLVHYYLDSCKSSATIPAKVLDAFDEDMQVLRSLGMKAIIRFSYVDSTYVEGKKESAHDAPLELVEQHIAQYASRWQANADVIFCFQAGIIGAWGEWYYSDNFGNKASHMNEQRSALIDTLLKAVPRDRCIQLRTPLFKTEYLNDDTPLNAMTAYDGSPKARLGHHNDAFLYDATNMGTYTDTTTQKPYVAQETLYVPVGGETDIEDAKKAKDNASYEKTIAEMSRMHWTFIQSGYSEVVTDMWRTNGTFDELNRRMGYRYQLVSGTYSDEAAQGGKLSVHMQIRNTGFAPLYNERPAYIVLKAQTAPYTTYPFQLDADPRTWLPNGVVSEVNEEITIPAELPQGVYQLYLYLPDAYASLANDPRYAVRFANADVWDSETGLNALGATVTITEPAADPDPDPEPYPEPYTPGEPVLLPATLNKANVNAYSEDMTWYLDDYFDFGSEDAKNTGRWADWTVELRYPGKYKVSAEGSYPNGHQWQMSLVGTDKTYSLGECWNEGEVIENGEGLWDLSGVAKGNYTIRVQNIMEWGQPKLKRITLQYDGEIPTTLSEKESATKAVKMLRDGRLLIERNGMIYNALGAEVK